MLVTVDEPVGFTAMSPDGRRIAYRDGGTISVGDVATGESESVAEGITAAWWDDTLLVVPTR